MPSRFLRYLENKSYLSCGCASGQALGWLYSYVYSRRKCVWKLKLKKWSPRRWPLGFHIICTQ